MFPTYGIWLITFLYILIWIARILTFIYGGNYSWLSWNKAGNWYRTDPHEWVGRSLGRGTIPFRASYESNDGFCQGCYWIHKTYASTYIDQKYNFVSMYVYINASMHVVNRRPYNITYIFIKWHVHVNVLFKHIWQLQTEMKKSFQYCRNERMP